MTGERKEWTTTSPVQRKNQQERRNVRKGRSDLNEGKAEGGQQFLGLRSSRHILPFIVSFCFLEGSRGHGLEIPKRKGEKKERKYDEPLRGKG